MPRDGSLVWCDYCGIFLAPLGKKAKAGERASAVLDDKQMVCVKCAERHGITALAPKTAPASSRATVPTAPAPAITEDPAQVALDALPAWIKEDGARHGHNRLKAATAEAERLSAPAPKPAQRPAPPRPESLSYRPPAISAAEEEIAYSGSTALLDLMESRPVTELEWPEGQTLPPVVSEEFKDELHTAAEQLAARASAPADRDTKEAPKPARPVRRPARPRREASATALAALAPASDTDEAAAIERIRDESVGAPAPRPWAQEMPGPASPVRKPQPRTSSRPNRTREQIAAERFELALAYAEKHGTLMAPPSRRPIVTAEEIRSGMRVLPELEDEAPLEYHPDVYLKDHEATRYLGVGPTTLSRWRAKGEGPAFISDNGKILYQVAELEQFRAGRVRAPRPAAARPQTQPRPSRAEALDQLLELLEQGQDSKSAVATAGFSSIGAAREAARRAGRTEIIDRLNEQGKRALIATGRLRGEQQRQEAMERLDRFIELVDQGVDREEAAGRAGYSGLDYLRTAARKNDRQDVLALLPNRRKKSTVPEGRAA